MFELSLTLLISTFCHHVLSKVCMDHSFEPSELTKYGAKTLCMHVVAVG